MGFVTSNKITEKREFGLAVNDDLKNIAYFSANKELTVYDRSKIFASEYKSNHREIMNSKSKVPVVSWNATDNTKGEVVKIFTSADLFITLNDISSPLLKLKFYDETIAEKYNSLLHLVMANKQ